MGWIPPPWVVLALVFTFASNVGDVHQLLVLSLRAAVGGKDSGCELCHHTTAFILKVSELDEADAVDCNNLCFGTRKCSEVCSKIMTALATSKQYPCVAAGLSTSIGFMANMVVQAAALPAKACWIDPDYANPRAA